MEAGAGLGHRHALAGEIAGRFEPTGIGIIAGEIANERITRLLAAHAANHFQRALAREIIKTGGERSDAEIDIARCGGDRDRLRGVEKFQFDVETGLAKIALVLRDEHRRRRRQPEHADSGLQCAFATRIRKPALRSASLRAAPPVTSVTRPGGNAASYVLLLLSQTL